VTDKRVTQRGFRIYAEDVRAMWGTVKVLESSAAGKGAHVWIFYDQDKGVSDTKLDPQLSVEAAKVVRDALDTFIREAEADELTEPALEETDD
jgi:hypothetical protein